jgi:hypothetical protein
VAAPARFPWVETGLGWRCELPGGILLLVNRAHRGGGYSWELSAFRADDDARGMQPTDASAKYVAEKAYKALLARPL